MILHLPVLPKAVFVLLVNAAALIASPDQPIVEPLDVMIAYAQGGDPSAQFNLGLRYGKGDGVPKDPKLSEQWYRRAAQGGFGLAQFNLGVMYANGTDVPKDDKEAIKWFFQAAQQGVFDAQKILIQFYATGRGVEKSPAKALAWDFLARRTLELRFSQRAGDAPHPPVVRKDGAAEIVQPDGTKKVVHPDGGVETAGVGGKRIFTYGDGRKKEVLPDGTQITRNPEGFEETRFPDGRITHRDPKGTSETSFPDGHSEMEGSTVDSAGRPVRITEVKDKTGKRVSRRIVRENRTVFENESRPYLIETVLKDERGTDVKLSEVVEPDGAIGKGRLTRISDGNGPGGSEIWTIRRLIEPPTGRRILVSERYSGTGLVDQAIVGYEPDLPKNEFRPGAAFDNTVPMLPEPRNAGFANRVRQSGLENDFRQALDELGDLEAKLSNFAGATESDWNQAKAAAQGFIIPFINPPQKAGATPNWLTLRTMTQNSLPEAMLKPSADDGTRQYSLGFHGREAIKLHAWRHSQTAHFIVHYVDEGDARLTMQYIEGAYAVVRNLLGLDPARGATKSHVFLFPTKQSWQDYLAKSNNSSRLAGFAYKNELLLPIVMAGTEQGDSIKTLCHEATHAIIAIFYAGKKPPLWLNEGLAEYVAARTVAVKRGAPDKNRVQNLPSNSRDVDVPGLFQRVRYEVPAPEGGTIYEERVENGVAIRVPVGIAGVAGVPGGVRGAPQTFYPDSERCVSALCEKLALDGFPKFFNALVAGNSPDAALRHAYGAKCPDVVAFAKLVNSR